MRFALLVSLLGIISCGRSEEVHVTIDVASSITSKISTIRSLDIAVLGDQPYYTRYGISGELDKGKTTWVYRATIKGQLQFEMVARDIDSNIVASGKSSVIKTAGTPVSAHVTLDSTTPNPNKGRLGESCMAGVDTCASGFCVDGVCCSTACTGSCNTCNGITPGTCAPAQAGTNPRAACTADSTNACGLDGTCDGVGACRKAPPGKTCAAATCKMGTVTPVSTCDGMGTCSAPTTFDCAPYACNPAGNACATICECDTGTSCTDSAQCATSVTCTNGSCGQVGLGGACATNSDCTAGTCVDGTCCDSATCGGPCQSCREPGHEGHCTNTAQGVADPHGVCIDQGATSCGHTGKCDGSGACANYAKNTECAAAVCTPDGTTFLDPSQCAGDGSACPVRKSTSCGPYVCVTDGGPGCAVSCGQCVYYESGAEPPVQASCAVGKTCENDCLGSAAAWTCQ